MESQPTTDSTEGHPPRIKWDAIAGAALVLIGLGAYLLGGNLRVGTIGRMGPGYVPISISFIVMALGALLLVLGLKNPAERVEWPGLRPAIIVLACPAAFALLIGPLGLVLTIIIVASIARLADKPDFGFEAFLMPPILAGLCVIIFSYLLQLPTPLWP